MCKISSMSMSDSLEGQFFALMVEKHCFCFTQCTRGNFNQDQKFI